MSCHLAHSFNSRRGFVIIQVILYLIFGVLTTIINIFAYWALTRVMNVPVVPSTALAWLMAVLFAYATNKKYVFHSKSNSVIKEASEFFAARIATGIMDVIIMWVFVDILGFHDVWIKTASNILVVIFNYIASKFFIFKGDKS